MPVFSFIHYSPDGVCNAADMLDSPGIAHPVGGGRHAITVFGRGSRGAAIGNRRIIFNIYKLIPPYCIKSLKLPEYLSRNPGVCMHAVGVDA